MGSIVIIKPLSAALSSAINKSQQKQEKLLGMPRIEPRGAGK